MVMDLFGKVYEPYYFPGFAQKMEEQPDFVSKLNYLNLHAAESGMKLYLIIDEYDNFTNIVLNEQGKDIYHALTHASGFYREIFKKFKYEVISGIGDWKILTKYFIKPFIDTIFRVCFQLKKILKRLDLNI